MNVYKPWMKSILMIFILAYCILLEVDFLRMQEKAIICKNFTDNQSLFQQLFIDPEWVSMYLEEKDALEKESKLKNMTMSMLYHDFNVLDQNRINQTPFIWKNIMKGEAYSTYYEKYKAIFDDLKMFPVPDDLEGRETISYENTWGAERSYGEGSIHEGTDIMTSNNERGYFPIISMTDGTVEQKGWLEKGGYRIGIRSPSGAYFYYAHLCEYVPDLEIGDTVKAGRLLGSMGDTGYGKEEGTIGNFDVHLHMGVYLNLDGGEMAVNPYYLLNALEKKRVTFRRK